MQWKLALARMRLLVNIGNEVPCCRRGSVPGFVYDIEKHNRPDCHDWDYDCSVGIEGRVTTSLTIISLGLYVFLLMFYLTTTFKQLRSRPARYVTCIQLVGLGCTGAPWAAHLKAMQINMAEGMYGSDAADMH